MSAFLCLYRLMKKSPEEYTVSLRDVRLDSYMLKQIVSNGLPAGIQNSVIAIANVVVQSNINSFGKLAVAGCGAYSKVEGFGFLPITCFSMGLTTFISQNLGAKENMTGQKKEPVLVSSAVFRWQRSWELLCILQVRYLLPLLTMIRK